MDPKDVREPTRVVIVGVEMSIGQMAAYIVRLMVAMVPAALIIAIAWVLLRKLAEIVGILFN